MTKSPEEYLKEPYSRILVPDENGSFFAEIMEFPGCYAEGKTADEAIHNLEEAAKSWIAVSIEEEHDIPEPLMNQGFGGKVALRLPRSLHRQAVRMAERDGVSLNQFLISAIAARVGAENFYSQLIEKYQRQFQYTAAGIFNIYAMQFTQKHAESINQLNFNESNLWFSLKSKSTTSEIMEVKQYA
jgi:predicted RNase H-like HicB family nuclease